MAEVNYHNRFIQEHCKLITLDKISTFFNPPFSYLLRKVECLIFGLLPFQVNSFCILFSSLIICIGTLVTREKCMILDIAKVLKIVIVSSRVKCCILHNFSTFSIFQTRFYFPLNFFLHLFLVKFSLFLQYFQPPIKNQPAKISL